MPARRSGACEQNSASQRLCAIAPAYASSGILDGAGRQPGTEGRRLHPGDGVGVGEHHLAGDAVGVELLVALLGVEGAAEALLVVALPVHDVVVIELQRLFTVGVALGEEVVERAQVLGVEVRPVLLARQPGVAVGRDDQVALGHGSPFGRRIGGDSATLAFPDVLWWSMARTPQRGQQGGSAVVSILGQYCINVRDLERAIEFWNGVCGLPVISRTDIPQAKEAILQSPHGGSRMQLAQQLDNDAPIDMGTAMWKLYVNTDDVQSLYDAAIAAGCESVMEPTHLDRWPVTMAYVKDFDGYLVEFVEYDDAPPAGVPEPEGVRVKVVS